MSYAREEVNRKSLQNDNNNRRWEKEQNTQDAESFKRHQLEYYILHDSHNSIYLPSKINMNMRIGGMWIKEGKIALFFMH